MSCLMIMMMTLMTMKRVGFFALVLGLLEYGILSTKILATAMLSAAVNLLGGTLPVVVNCPVVMLLQTGPREDAAGRNMTKKMETR